MDFIRDQIIVIVMSFGAMFSDSGITMSTGGPCDKDEPKSAFEALTDVTNSLDWNAIPQEEAYHATPEELERGSALISKMEQEKADAFDKSVEHELQRVTNSLNWDAIPKEEYRATAEELEKGSALISEMEAAAAFDQRVADHLQEITNSLNWDAIPQEEYHATPEELERGQELIERMNQRAERVSETGSESN